MSTDRKNSPELAPSLYRKATIEDILSDKVHGFYEPNGSYWRKNGKVKTWKTRPGHARVPVKFGLRAYGYIDHDNIDLVYVRLPHQGG